MTAQDWLSEGDGVDPAKLVRRGQVLARPTVAVPVRPIDPPADDPDVPFEPLPPGALDNYLRNAGMLPEPEPDVARAVEQAHDLLGRSMGQLARIAADPATDTGDRIAAVREMGKIADAVAGRQATRARRSVDEIEAEIERELRAAGWQVTRPG